jgi:ABC-type glutathione transport system ATPase component
VSDAAPLLRVESLSVDFGQQRTVDGISFDIARGRCLGVIGESGAGKTQLFLGLLGLLPPQATVTGQAFLGDTALIGAGAREVRGRRAAMIFQDPMTALTPHLRIGDQVAEPLVAHHGRSWSEARAEAVRLLERVRLTEAARRARQYPHELSGGMRQRITIAMALAGAPELLIADEPTTALDVSVQTGILALLRQLVVDGLTLAVITHDMGVIAGLADDVLVMRAGKSVELGTVGAILKTPRAEYTRALLAATPRLDESIEPTATPAVGTAPLSARHVSVRYPVPRGPFRRAHVFQAVADVSLTVAPGEALGIVGESGSGKTSLTRALMRLSVDSTGEVAWLGRDVHALHGSALRPLRDRAQIVFQDPFASLDPVMSVAEIVAEPLRALRPAMNPAARAERVLRLLEGVGLDATYLTRRSRELSGGQNQRVAIARAMIIEPQLLVCDEAVSALDVSVQAQVLELLASFKRARGTSIVFVSHNLAVVRRLCDRVLVMYQGKVVEEGAVAEVFAAPRHAYTRLLLESVPRLDPATERARLAAHMTDCA